ncbi:MAG: 1-phosphofructokinase [Clostridium sp.]|nr:1-phosphofructokinase [Clostridium sp.]
MVITVTLNPALDKTIVLDTLQVGQVNRIQTIQNDMGGKGINVSKGLNEFKVPTMALGFLGGPLESVFREELRDLNIVDKFISIQGVTRTNIKIVDQKNKTYTDINEQGPIIREDELHRFIKSYEKVVDKGDIVVIAGGLSLGIPAQFYGTLTAVAKEKGAYVIVDAEGEALKNALTQIPDVIKPNEKEFSRLYGVEDLSEYEMVIKAQGLIEKGVEKVLISRGHLGSILITKDQVLLAGCLDVDVKSTVGAGDSMVSALVYSYINKLSDEDTLAMAQAAGASTVMTEGTKVCTLKEVKEKLKWAKEKITQEKRYK